MKNAYIFIFLIIFLMSCKSKKNDYVEIKRSQINYRIFFEDNMKDSIALHFPYAYIIKNILRSVSSALIVYHQLNRQKSSFKSV